MVSEKKIFEISANQKS